MGEFFLPFFLPTYCPLLTNLRPNKVEFIKKYFSLFKLIKEISEI